MKTITEPTVIKKTTTKRTVTPAASKTPNPTPDSFARSLKELVETSCRLDVCDASAVSLKEKMATCLNSARSHVQALKPSRASVSKMLDVLKAEYIALASQIEPSIIGQRTKDGHTTVLNKRWSVRKTYTLEKIGFKKASAKDAEVTAEPKETFNSLTKQPVPSVQIDGKKVESEEAFEHFASSVHGVFETMGISSSQRKRVFLAKMLEIEMETK